MIHAGSSLKLCRVAEGEADLYPRFGPTMEWDIAAGHAILKEAKGILLSHPDQKSMTYNKPSLKNDMFIAQSIYAQELSYMSNCLDESV